MVDAVRDRVEVSWHHETWHVTAGSFESALAYVDDRFDDPLVLSRRDHGRRWTRVTLDVTEDPARASEAPPLDALGAAGTSGGSRHEDVEWAAGPESVPGAEMPLDLEEIFAHQNVGCLSRATGSGSA